jgi:hypothetical protein
MTHSNLPKFAPLREHLLRLVRWAGPEHMKKINALKVRIFEYQQIFKFLDDTLLDGFSIPDRQPSG